jgi:DNA-binding MarR family transcriptional regulator
MDFFTRTGKIALGSRLRMLTATVTEDAEKIYHMYGVTLAPKWFPVFFILSEDGGKTITEIAADIGHSQPSVTKIVREMAAAGLITEKSETSDKRRTLVALTKRGKALIEKIKDQYTDIDKAIDGIIAGANHNLWHALEEWELLLREKSLFKRVLEEKKVRESQNIHVVNYEPKYRAAFKSLNEEWISKYFEMEEADHKALDNPEQYILKQGGHILIALDNGEPVGACALIKMKDPDYDYELAKMAVSPKARGKNIGWMLGVACINRAKDSGASKLYLESNTILKPAISLYYKLGFKRVTGRPTPYKRCNIQMELDLHDPGITFAR